MAVYNPPRNGTAAKAVSLDLVLRTLMNSTDFHISNTRVWDSISKMVPGTTPQQCARRWDELLQSNPNSVAGDISGLSAKGRPISGHERKSIVKRSRSSSSHLSSERITELSWSADTLRIDKIDENNGRPSSSTQLRKSYSFQGTSGLWDYPVVEMSTDSKITKGLSQVGSSAYVSEWSSGDNVPAKPKIKGSFASSFCQSVLSHSKHSITDNYLDNCSSSEFYNSGNGQAEGKENDKTSDYRGERTAQDITIKVSDESKKAHKKFYCSRDILLQEMPYFQKYLNEKLTDAEISVHCDIKIFEWLINYVKKRASKSSEKRTDRGMMKLKMEPPQSVSILISSYFLKMEPLVEESLEFCYRNMTEVLETNGNLNCISQPLLKRLAAKFSPMEVEEVRDKKDKIKSKLFLYQLEQLFIPEYSNSECPSNASTLYLCKYCNQLLTTAQETILPCTTERLNIDVLGKITYKHERSLMWNVNSYIRSLQQSEALTPRDIYWRLWGIINMLLCEKCHTHFQCWDLKGCRCHTNPNSLTGPAEATRSECSCSGESSFAILPQQKEHCCHREHQVLLAGANNTIIYPIVLKLRDVICKPPISQCYQQKQQKQQRSPVASPIHQPSNSMDNTLNGLLQTQKKCSNYTNNSGTVDGERLAVPATNDTILTCGPNAGSKQQQQQQLLSPQDLSELEEDDEVDRKTSQFYTTVNTTKSRKKGHKNQRQKYNSSDWVWNSSKTKVWNQDMQRENDEKRQNALSTQLSQISTTESSSGKSEVQASYAGGIYPRLEAQFRAQHLAKTTMQSKSLLTKKRT